MSFIIDQETYKDLGIFQSGTEKSIFSFFNKTKTEGGRILLHQTFRQPLNDIQQLKDRREIIYFFHSESIEVEIDYHQFDSIEHYLSFNRDPNRANRFVAFFTFLNFKLNGDQDYYRISSGIKNVIKLFRSLFRIKEKIFSLEPPLFLQERFKIFEEFLKDKILAKNVESVDDFNYLELNYLDNLFRRKKLKHIRALVAFSYELDMYETLSKMLSKGDWCLPDYVDETLNISIKGLYHPLISKPISNDFTFLAQDSVVFVTGPNMAGKSSFLKALGITVFLSHLGFPVPAKELSIPVFNGLLTTINLPDSLTEGLSHFYAEVRRIKKIAQALQDPRELFIILDEPFKGTNLKDAIDSTALLVSSLSKIKHSKFFISSHFTEIISGLSANEGISFNCFDCYFKNGQLVFPYLLQSGVSNKRVGSYILEKEGIFNILKEC